MRGRMQVAILHLKSRKELPGSSGLSSGMHGTVTNIFGGTSYGIDPKAEVARETARLHAYNDLLRQKECKSFDLQTELAPTVMSQS